MRPTTDPYSVCRRLYSLGAGSVDKRSWMQSMGMQANTLWLPVWQYHPEDKAASAWLYETGRSAYPQQKLTWLGVKSLEDGRHLLEGNTVRYLACWCIIILSLLYTTLCTQVRSAHITTSVYIML